MIKCKHCGALNPDGSRFCEQCGSRLEGAPEAMQNAGMDTASSSNIPPHLQKYNLQAQEEAAQAAKNGNTSSYAAVPGTSYAQSGSRSGSAYPGQNFGAGQNEPYGSYGYNPNAGKKKSGMGTAKKVFLWIGGILLCAGIVAGAFYGGRWLAQKLDKDNAPVQQQPAEGNGQTDDPNASPDANGENGGSDVSQQQNSDALGSNEGSQAQQEEQKNPLEDSQNALSGSFSAAPEQSREIGGFGPGLYKLNFNMNIRQSPDYDAAKIDKFSKDATVTIEEVVSGPKDSIWGRLGSGGYICIKDNDQNYLTKN